MLGKFIVVKIRKEKYTFKLKAGNGEIIAVGKPYRTVDACKGGIEIVKGCAFAHIEDQTMRTFEPITHPKYEIYRDVHGRFRFQLRDDGGEVIAFGEGYTAKASCLNGISSIARNAPQASVIAEE